MSFAKVAKVAKVAKEQKECGYMRRHSGNFPLQLSPVIDDCKHEKVIRQKLHCYLDMLVCDAASVGYSMLRLLDIP